jgi:hypothetical protein
MKQTFFTIKDKEGIYRPFSFLIRDNGLSITKVIEEYEEKMEEGDVIVKVSFVEEN